MKERIRNLYRNSLIDANAVKKAVSKKLISLEDAIEILGSEDEGLGIVKANKLDEISAACKAAIHAGVDVTLNYETKHFSLTEEDQINLSTAAATIKDGALAFPYHADGELCRMFTTAEINTVLEAATAYKMYQTTYCNHMNSWIKRETDMTVLQSITYGDALPEDLAMSIAELLGTSEG